jgi:hypothetical protein
MDINGVGPAELCRNLLLTDASRLLFLSFSLLFSISIHPFPPYSLYQICHVASLDQGLGICDKDGCVPVYLSIMAILKDEAPYLAEWVEYHLLVDVNQFWLIDNNSSDNPSNVLQPYITAGFVNLTSWPAQGQQEVIYNHFLPILKRKSYWLAVIDIDEFLVPVITRSVAMILRSLEYACGVSVNWVTYGTNGKAHKEDGLVIERFKRHSEWQNVINRHTKVIMNPRKVRKLIVHDHHYLNGEHSRNVFGVINEGDFLGRPPVHEVLRLNHYWTKSVQEFVQKRLRGSVAICGENVIPDLLAEVTNHIKSIADVIENDTVINWAIPLIKANLMKRS